jgi:hypothetical protein
MTQNENQPEQLYHVLGKAKSERIVPLAFTVPDDLPPVVVEGFTIYWTKEALAAFAQIPKDVKNLPYAWLRGAIEVSLPNVSRLTQSMGLHRDALTEEGRKKPQLFAYVDGGDETEIKKALSPLLDDWIANQVVPFAEREDASREGDRLQELFENDGLVVVKPFKSQALPWSQYGSGTAKAVDSYSFRILADYIARHLAGKEIFQCLGPIKRIVVNRGGMTSGAIELISEPIEIPGKGSFSLAIHFEIVTFPGVHQPLLTMDVKKRRWIRSLKSKSFVFRNVNGLIFSDNHPDRAFSYKVSYNSNQQEWETDSAFELLRRELKLEAQRFSGREIARGAATTEECQVLLNYREGIEDKNEDENDLKAGVPEIDKLEAFDAIAKILEPLGIKPFDAYNKVKAPQGKDDAASRAIDDVTLLSAVVESLETGNLSEFDPKYLDQKNIDALLKEIGLKDSSESADTVEKLTKKKQKPKQTKALEKLIDCNQKEIERLYPEDRKPLLVIFYEEQIQKDVKLLENIIQVLWANSLEIQKSRLPANTHGPKAELPGSNLKNKERSRKRIEAWESTAKQLEQMERSIFCLVVANEFYGNQHDDRVNKPSTRQALASIAGARVQFLLPPQRTKKGTIKLSDFLFRLQSSMKDLLWAHCGRIDGVKEKVDKCLKNIFFAENTPQEIVGITVVRKQKGRARGFIEGTFLAIAIRINVETGQCEMCCTYEGKNGEPTAWEPFADALSTVSQISPVKLGDNKELRKTRFMRFVEEIISNSVEEGKKPLVIIDSSNCAQLWGWLTDTQIDVSKIDIGDREWMQDTWKDARIIRVRQDLAPGIVEDKVKHLAETSEEDERPKEQLTKDLQISAPSSAMGLFKLEVERKNRLKKTNNTGCVAYLSVGRKTLHQKKRGPSCYRKTQEDKDFKRKNDKDKLETVFNKAELQLSTLEEREPWVDMWPTPNPLEIVVTLRQESDDPDRLAALVESLRYQFGHYSDWTSLPAPLFFERVVRDYISDFALEEEDDSE